jgi:hypothetical protein
MVKRSALTVLSVLAVFSLCGAGGNEAKLPDFLWWARFTTGQVVSSVIDSGSGAADYIFEKQWLKSVDAGVRAVRQIGTNTVGRFNGGFGIVYAVRPYTGEIKSTESTQKKVVPYLLDASLQSTFGFYGGRDTIQVEGGYFPFKYSPQAQCFGEYLYRTGTYPGFIVSGFEQANMDKPKVCGLHLSYLTHAWGTIKQDLLLSSEMDFFPLHDLNLTYIVTCEPNRLVNFGLGVEFARFLSVDEKKTTPGTDTINFNKQSSDSRKWFGYVDPQSNDTILYTFRGTKLMARLTINPQSLFPWPAFGREDLKIYCEAAVLGVKDYPGWYEHIGERIPVMFGFNVPAFKLLDVLSVEGEWYGSKYWNSQEFIWKSAVPIPYTGHSGGPEDPKNYTALNDNHWKWSVYASKKITSFLRISAQAASDHTPRTLYTPGPPSFLNYTEITSRSRDWYYMMRISMYF